MQSGSSQGSLEDSIKLSFSFSIVTKKTSASRQGHWPLHRCTALFGISTVSEHSKLSEVVSMTNGNVVNLWHYDKFLHHLEQQTPLVNWTTRLLRLRSCLILSFHLASLSVPFSVRALPSTSRFIISVKHTHLIFIQWICFHSKTLQGCIHLVPVNCKFSFLWYRWTGSSPRPCWT